MSKTVEYLFEYAQLKYEETIDFIIEWLKCNVKNSTELKIEVLAGNTRKMRLEQIKPYLLKKNSNIYNLAHDDLFDFSFSHSNLNYTHINISDYCDGIFNPMNLETLSNEYMLQKNSFFGDIRDDNYHLKQNETMVSNYKMDYGSLDNVKTYIDHVGRERIDISENPGRRIRKTGLVEAVGSTMWLSDKFFEITGADKTQLSKLEWLQIEQLSDTVIRITSWPEPFNSAEGEQGRRQVELRKILYPNSKD